MRSVVLSWPAVGLYVLLLAPRLAEAVPVIDFNIAAPTSGLIRHDGSSAPLIAQNVSVDNVVGIDTPSNADVPLTILNGLLSFMTGSRLMTDSREWYFAPGGTFTISGRLDLNGNSVADPGEIMQPLFTGAFSDVVHVSAITSTFRIISGAFTGSVSPAMAAYYGLPDGATYGGGINLSFSSGRTPPQSFTSTQPLSGDIAVSVTVPEASTLLLVGIAMVVAGVIVRRPKNAQDD